MQAPTKFEVSQACKQSGWRQQFGRPTGWRVQAVELLDFEPEARVLEIGFGPGKAIFEAARGATRTLRSIRQSLGRSK